MALSSMSAEDAKSWTFILYLMLCMMFVAKNYGRVCMKISARSERSKEERFQDVFQDVKILTRVVAFLVFTVELVRHASSLHFTFLSNRHGQKDRAAKEH